MDVRLRQPGQLAVPRFTHKLAGRKRLLSPLSRLVPIQTFCQLGNHAVSRRTIRSSLRSCLARSRPAQVSDTFGPPLSQATDRRRLLGKPADPVATTHTRKLNRKTPLHAQGILEPCRGGSARLAVHSDRGRDYAQRPRSVTLGCSSRSDSASSTLPRLTRSGKT